MSYTDTTKPNDNDLMIQDRIKSDNKDFMNYMSIPSGVSCGTWSNSSTYSNPPKTAVDLLCEAICNEVDSLQEAHGLGEQELPMIFLETIESNIATLRKELNN